MTKLLDSLSILTFFCSLIACVVLNSSVAQYHYSDYQFSTDINQKGEIGLYLSNEYERHNLDSLKILGVDMLMVADEHQNEFVQAVGNRALGSYLLRKGQVDQALHSLKSARRYFEKKADYHLLSETYNIIGNAYYLKGKHKEAIRAYKQSIEFGEHSKHETSSFNGKLGLGRAYCAHGDTAVGILVVEEYTKKSVRLKKYEAAADGSSFLAMIEMDRGDMEKSKLLYAESLIYSQKSKSKIHLSHAYNNKAILHFNLGEMDSSLLYFRKALKIREEMGHEIGVIESYFNLASFFFVNGPMDSSIVYFQRSRDRARKNKFNRDEMDALSELQVIFEKQNNRAEIDRIEQRMLELKSEIQESDSVDNEIIAYALEIQKEYGEVKAKTISAESNRVYIWILLIPILLIVGYGIKRLIRN